jgi:3-phenylpropionate/cinnamic acid dioxygenase small subunit
MASETYAEVATWLIDEAELLDRRELRQWLARLAPGIRYLMPARSTVYRSDGFGISTTNHHFDENLGSITTRVRRILEATNYAEDPPTRTRRFVTNIRAYELADVNIAARSYLLVLRSRGDSPNFEFVSCEREDRFTRGEEGLQLAWREITIDQATLGTVHLGIML